MKKKILFIISNMESGGFQKSLISLLQCFDFKRYEVDLMVLSQNGIFMSQIPDEVNIINTKISNKFFTQFPKSIKLLLKEKEVMLALKRCMIFIMSRFNKGISAIYISKIIPSLPEEYDVAIDYNGQQILYYMIDKIKAKKKISYFHSDYKKWNYYLTSDKRYYPKVDYIITISEICKQSLDDLFPDCRHKIKVIENISSPDIINKMAKEKIDVNLSNEFINLVMVATPSSVKGYDFAIEACKRLKDEGYKIRWYAVGTSSEVHKFKELVKKLDIAQEFIFVGETINPYPYMKQADIYVQPSRFEGKSIAIDEAKILHKPIIITNFTTSSDHIKNEYNGLIVNMSSYDLYEGIKRLIDNKNLRDFFVNNLSSESLGNKLEVIKLYELIDKEGEESNK